MKYNDYPILNEETYSILNSNYSLKSHVDRKTYANKVFYELSTCLNLCFQLKQEHNKAITSSIKQTKHELSLLLENFNATFNMSETKKQSFSDCNVFKIVKKILNIISISVEWRNAENKEYYINFINHLLKILIKINSDLISSFETSNMKFFKFM